MYFGVLVAPVSGIEDLSNYLGQLETAQDAFVIRGHLVLNADETKTYRRTKENFRTPDAGKLWVLIDFDKQPIPSDIDVTKDPRSAIEHLVKQLPSEFHDVSYHYQLSSSAGFSKTGTLSAHVWFWLTEPWPDAKLKIWGKAVNQRAGCKLIDAALFNDVQAHYTAAPHFEGVENPFPKRSALVEKTKDAVTIREIKLSEQPKHPTSGAFEASPGFEGWLSRIGDHPGGDGFHEPIIKAIASYVRTHGRDDTNVEALYETVRARILAADRSTHSTDYIEKTASREQLIVAIEGALTKYGDQPTSRRKSKVIEGGTPPAARPVVSSTEAHQKLSDTLDAILLGSGT